MSLFDKTNSWCLKNIVLSCTVMVWFICILLQLMFLKVHSHFLQSNKLGNFPESIETLEKFWMQEIIFQCHLKNWNLCNFSSGISTITKLECGHLSTIRISIWMDSKLYMYLFSSLYLMASWFHLNNINGFVHVNKPIIVIRKHLEVSFSFHSIEFNCIRGESLLQSLLLKFFVLLPKVLWRSE